MRFLLDHDVPAEVGHLLRHWGHDALALPDALPITAQDEEVFRHAQEAGRIMVSCNRGHFLGLAAQCSQAGQTFPGLIVLIRRRTRQAECAHLLRLLQRAGAAGLADNVNFA